MNQNTDYTPVALYARVSSERQDVDLSVAGQLRALRDYAEKNGSTSSPASTWTRPRTAVSPTAPSPARRLTGPASPTLLSSKK